MRAKANGRRDGGASIIIFGASNRVRFYETQIIHFRTMPTKEHN